MLEKVFKGVCVIMSKGKFHPIEDSRITKFNLLLFGFGIIAVCVTGFCYTTYLQNKNERVVKYVNRASVYDEKL